MTTVVCMSSGKVGCCDSTPNRHAPGTRVKMCWPSSAIKADPRVTVLTGVRRRLCQNCGARSHDQPV